MNTFGGFNEMAVANGSTPYVFGGAQNEATENMSPRFKHVPNYGGYHFGCNPSETSGTGGTLEPPHVHAFTKQGAVGKFWLEDENTGGVSVDPHKTKGIPQSQINGFVKHVQKYKEQCLVDWDEWVKNYNLQNTLNPQELTKFNEREKKRGNEPYVPAQQTTPQNTQKVTP